MDRRKAIKIGLAAGLTGSFLGGIYTVGVEPHWRITRTLPMPIQNLPPSWVGRRIVQLSDIHVGRLVSDEYLRESFRAVNDLAPDLILITGDFMSCYRDEQIAHTAEIFKELKPGKLGTYAVLGNHDYGGRVKVAMVADKLVEALKPRQVQFLRNETTTVDGLKLVGMDDYWGLNFYPEEATQNLTGDEPAICLCHNPDVCDQPVWGKFRGWVLAGHTHGGQCKPPFLPPPLLPVKNKAYTSGLFELDAARTLYINPALGYVRRVRIGVRPEITVFEPCRA
jgi:uncharacterized protein